MKCYYCHNGCAECRKKPAPSVPDSLSNSPEPLIRCACGAVELSPRAAVLGYWSAGDGFKVQHFSHACISSNIELHPGMS